jgi:hypothetical protein
MKLATARLMIGWSKSQRRLTVDWLAPKIAPTISWVIAICSVIVW